jgi:glucokinase
MFCRFLGTFASSVALTTGARGGVYLAGGIVQAIRPLLAEGVFRQRFEDNPAMHHYLAPIPTILMTEPYPALRGAALKLTFDAPGRR